MDGERANGELWRWLSRKGQRDGETEGNVQSRGGEKAIGNWRWEKQTEYCIVNFSIILADSQAWFLSVSVLAWSLPSSPSSPSSTLSSPSDSSFCIPNFNDSEWTLTRN